MGTISGLSTPVERAIFQGGPAASPLPRADGSGLNVGDSLVAVQHITDDLVTNADVSGEASIPTADKLQLTTTDTSGAWVVVLYKKAT